MRKNLLATLSVAAALLATNAAHATIKVYTDQASYLAAISAPWVDTFDYMEVGTHGHFMSNRHGDYSYGYSAAPLEEYYYGALGSDVYLMTANSGDTMSFYQISSQVRGFGGYFFGTDYDTRSTGATMVLTASDADGKVTQKIFNSTPTSFVGFVSNQQFSTVTMRTETRGSFSTVNNIIVGAAPVPEPATYGMMAVGLALLGLVKRRKA